MFQVRRGGGLLARLLGWVMRLPEAQEETQIELTVVRSAEDEQWERRFDGRLLATLPFWRWQGAMGWALGALLLAEIGITLRDFVVEDTVRAPLGGVFPGERVMHALMGILYGAMLANLLPELRRWVAEPTALIPWEAPAPLRWVMPLMALGVFLSGLRDLGAVYGPRWCRFPWGSYGS